MISRTGKQAEDAGIARAALPAGGGSRTRKQAEDAGIARAALPAGGGSRTGKQAEDAGISRGNVTPAVFRRSERLATKFGGGKFGVGRFSGKIITREKHI